MEVNVSIGLSGRVFAGFVVPVVVEVVAAIIIVSTGSGSSAGPFAYVVVLLMLICAIPITLISNVLLVPSSDAVGPTTIVEV